jgi:ankyrin repeat protein
MSEASDSTASPILEALYRGDAGAAEQLASDASNLDVFEAAALGRADRLRELLDGAEGDVHAWSSDGFMPLHLAAFFGHADAAALLLDRGADTTIVSRHQFVKVTPLHSAVASEGAADFATARVLLERGASPSARAEQGFTPLHSAAANGDRPMVELLLTYGADRAARTDDRKTPFDLAQAAGHAEVAELLH